MEWEARSSLEIILTGAGWRTVFHVWCQIVDIIRCFLRIFSFHFDNSCCWFVLPPFPSFLTNHCELYWKLEMISGCGGSRYGSFFLS